MARNVVPIATARNQFAVNRANQHEGIWSPLYDYQAYGTGGSTIFTFFSVPVGQGTARAGGGVKTLEDTNMDVAGQLPAPKHFLCTGIEVVMFQGAATLSQLSAAAISTGLADLAGVLQRGFLNLFIGSKSYLVDGPLNVFPPSFGLAGMVAMAGTTTADTKVDSITYIRSFGKPYDISPVFIPSAQNFKVTLEFPDGAVTVGTAGVIGVRLLGFLYRLSQ